MWDSIKLPWNLCIREQAVRDIPNDKVEIMIIDSAGNDVCECVSRETAEFILEILDKRA